MGYLLTPESQELVSMVKNFAEREIKEQCKAYDVSGEFPADIMEKTLATQLHLIEVPEEHGGMGLDLVTVAAIYEELAKADAGIPSTLATSAMALKPLMMAGTAQQVKQVADVLAAGGYGAFALTEPAAGSDAANTRTTAVREGGEYIISGDKCFISNGGIADIYIVFAMTDKQAGTKGISAFLIERDRQGVSVGKEEDKMGLRLSNTTSVFFDNVHIPAENLIGQEGKGFGIAMKTLDIERILTAAITIGIAQRAMEEATAYAKERTTFGKPIIYNQGIQFMLADMDIKIETARQMMIHALNMAENGMRTTREAAIAKCYSSDMAMQVVTDALQVLGGYGYSREYPVEKLMRDAKVFQILEGTNQIQRMVIAGSLMR